MENIMLKAISYISTLLKIIQQNLFNTEIKGRLSLLEIV